jgi:hypothetical protein
MGLFDLLSGRRQPPPRRFGGYGRRPQRRGGFGMWGPFPSYSTRTRRGTNVRITGCCLPLALALMAAPVVALRVLVRR